MKKVITVRRALLFSAFAALAAIVLFAVLRPGIKAEVGDYAFSAASITSAPTDDFVHSTTAGNQAKTYSTYDKTNGELVLVNAPGGAAALDLSVSAAESNAKDRTAYLGGIFLVDPGTTDYTDFTFTLKFRVTEWVNDARWMGIMYRMQTDETSGLHSGYILTARANGASSYTSNGGVSTPAGNADNGFNDIDVKGANFSNRFTDGKYHTITITMSGDVATHYIDGKKIRDAAAADQDTNIARRSSGGFAIILSQLTVNVKSCTITRTVTAPEAETAPEAVINPVYAVTDFRTIAQNDWTPNHRSDVGGSTVRVDTNGELVVNAANAASDRYYGALLPVNPGAVYTNFTFDMQFRVNRSNGDNARWLGIVYRTKFASEAAPITGYAMNYRINGKNAYTAINEPRVFNDINVIESGNVLADGVTAPALNDGEYHRLTVIMQDNNVAKQYIDGFLIREAKTADQTSHLGKVHTEGGFAVIINSMEVNVKSCTITPNSAVVPEKAESDNTIVIPYTDSAVSVVNAPTVVCDVTDKATLDSLAGTKKPSNAILRLNKDEKVIDANGETLGSFADIYASLDHAIIPVVYVADDDACDALIAILTTKQKILDVAVMSDKPALVKKVRTACPRVRGIVEFAAGAEYTGNKLDLFNNIVAVANSHYAMVTVLPQSAATYDNVRYIQARFKTVWVRPDSTKTSDLIQSINSGAFGIVSADFAKTFSALSTYPLNSYTRMPYNVAHRGLRRDDYNDTLLCENSLNAVEGAIECGATHLELDGHMTKDGHLVIMHDDDLYRTTSCTQHLKIPNLTLDEVRQYKLLDGQKIPVVEDVFDLLYKAKQNGKDIVFVFELKAGKGIVEKIDSLLGTGEGQYDIRENLVIISFDAALLTSVKEVMPATPTSYLQGNSVGPGTFAADLAAMGMYNCGLDTCHSDKTDRNYDTQYLTARGIPSWYWTFGSNEAVTNAAKNGHLGLTNDRANALSAYVAKLSGGENSPQKSVKVNDRAKITVTNFNGTKITTDGRIRYVEETTAGWNVVASYTRNNMTQFTQLFSIARDTDTPVTPEDPKVEIVVNDSRINATIGSDGNVSFTAPEVAGKRFVGLYTDAQFTTPATAANITAGMTLYAKYEPVSDPDDPSKPDDPNKPTQDEKAPSDDDGVNLGLAVGLPVGLVCAAALGVGLFFIIRKKRKG